MRGLPPPPPGSSAGAGRQDDHRDDALAAVFSYTHEPGAYQVPLGQPPFSATVVPVAVHVRVITPALFVIEKV